MSSEGVASWAGVGATLAAVAAAFVVQLLQFRHDRRERKRTDAALDAAVFDGLTAAIQHMREVQEWAQELENSRIELDFDGIWQRLGETETYLRLLGRYLNGIVPNKRVAKVATKVEQRLFEVRDALKTLTNKPANYEAGLAISTINVAIKRASTLAAEIETVRRSIDSGS